MGKRRTRVEQFLNAPYFEQLPLAEKPIIEIAGERRVLIENHGGVKEYSHERITVQVSFGFICVAGSELELIRMTKEQLVILGRIQCVQLLRREDA